MLFIAFCYWYGWIRIQYISNSRYVITSHRIHSYPVTKSPIWETSPTWSSIFHIFLSILLDEGFSILVAPSVPVVSTLYSSLIYISLSIQSFIIHPLSEKTFITRGMIRGSVAVGSANTNQLPKALQRPCMELSCDNLSWASSLVNNNDVANSVGTAIRDTHATQTPRSLNSYVMQYTPLGLLDGNTREYRSTNTA